MIITAATHPHYRIRDDRGDGIEWVLLKALRHARDEACHELDAKALLYSCLHFVLGRRRVACHRALHFLWGGHRHGQAHHFR